MAEYIKREALIDKLLSHAFTDDFYGMGLSRGLEIAVAEAKRMPYREIPSEHGRWIKGVIEREPVIKNGKVFRDDRPTFQCSLCEETFAGTSYGFNYCPHCGAKMEA